jgi:hypothetical protein
MILMDWPALPPENPLPSIFYPGGAPRPRWEDAAALPISFVSFAQL